MKTTIEFSTSYYEMNHGKQPRGFGHWAFAESKNASNDEIMWAQGTLGQAKKEIRERIATLNPPAQGFIRLHVLP